MTAENGSFSNNEGAAENKITKPSQCGCLRLNDTIVGLHPRIAEGHS